MDGRPTSLHVSALSPPEYVTYKDYVELLATAQSGQRSPLSQQNDMYSSKKIEKSILRDFSLARLGASAINVDAVMAELPSAGSSRLSPEEIYAFLRVLAHLSRESAVPGERSIHIPPDYVYMPTEPMELVDEDSSVGAAPLESPFDDSNKARPPLPPSRNSKVSRRASMPVPKRKPPPPAPVASGYAPLTDSPKASPTMPQLGAIAQADNSSNNPFRRRHSSQPHPSGVLGKGWPKPAPPLPPRKPSASNGLPPAPSLPPRKVQHVKNLSSSSSVHSLQSSFTRLGQPTSTAAPSSLMRQSLQAAEKAKSVKSDDPRYIVIKRTGENQSDGQDTASDAPATPRPVQIRKQVAQALKQAENEQPPPKRVEVTKVVSAKETKKEPQVNGKKDEFATLAKPYLSANPSTTLWNCVDILSGEPKKEPVYAMIILNQPITNKEIFEKAWKASRLHFCADGGANRLHDLLDSSSRPKFMPDMIKGDLDSLRPKVKEYYSSRGVPVVQDKDEYSTDLMKCIEEVEKQEKELSIELPLLLIGGLSGRIDQTVHTMSLLHKLRTKRSHSYVLSGESLAWVLSEGPHLINIDNATMGQTCGILPVGVDKANVRTTGLKWNLDWETSFEGDVSTSNHLLPSEPVIFLHTDKPVLWCVEVTGH